MKTIKAEITISSDAEKVWRFITTLNHDDNFFKWHPDHLKLVIIRGNLHTPGSLIYFEENLGKKKKKLRLFCQIKHVSENKSLTLEIPFGLNRIFPVSGGCNIKQVSKNTSVFTIHARYGYSNAYLSSLIDRFLERFIIKRDDIEEHTKEELILMKEMIENEK